MADTADWIRAVRASHARFAALVAPLGPEQALVQSYDKDWSIAQVASHLGSQGEIFELFLDAGLSGSDAPGGEVFGPIWDRWNALEPLQQIRDSVSANERFVSRVEGVPAEQQESFSLSLFGLPQTLAGLCAVRLGEHAVHSWDIAVALDPGARLAQDAAELLVDNLAMVAGRSGRPPPGGQDASASEELSVHTVEPDRDFRLTLRPEVALTPAGAAGQDALTMPAEAFVRLVYGRLDPDTTPSTVADDPRLPALRTALPGF